MLKKVFILVAVIIVIFIAVVFMQPSEFHIQRSITIGAVPAEIFSHVNDLHQWHAWSPWTKLDPDAKETFEGGESGLGAIMHWDGNKHVGAGSMTITESKPNEDIRFQLDFLKPMKGTNTAEFTFKPKGNQTLVTWSMSGKSDGFICKAAMLVMNCNKMISDQFDKGLTDLKWIVESGKKS
ncbi:MAG: SRPBCC family protein [Chthoniobacterales bacterium]